MITAVSNPVPEVKCMTVGQLHVVWDEYSNNTTI